MQNASEQFEKMNREFTSRMQEMSVATRTHMDAVAQASSVIVEGMKDVNQAMVNHMQQAMQSAMATSKAMMGVKTMRELMEIQGEYVKASLGAMMADSTKISEMTVRMSSQAAEPITQVVTQTVEKISERVKRAA